MPTAEIRKVFDVTATKDQIALVEAALSRCSVNPAKFISRHVAVTFTPDLPRRKDGGPAEAFSRIKKREILIRPGMGAKRTQYLFIHEVGHFVDKDFLTERKRAELMALMVPEARGWLEGEYMELPCECFADAFAGAITDLKSPHEKFYTRDVPTRHLPRMLDIALREEPADEAGLAIDEAKPQPPILDDLMEEIVRIESSGRRLAQNPKSGASGLYGFMPGVWRKTASRVLGIDPGLARADKSLKPAEWRPELSANNQHKVAAAEFKRLSRRFDGDLQKIAASWRNGEGFVSRTPVQEWTRGLVLYVNSACTPLGFAPLPVPPPKTDEPGPQAEEEASDRPAEDRVLPINILDHEVGSIRKGTKVFYPSPDAVLTTLRNDAPRATLLGATEDGKFRFVMVTSDKFPGTTRGNPIKGLALVAASDVTEVRVEPPTPVDASQLDELRRRKAELEEQIAVLTSLRDKVEQALREAAEQLDDFVP